MFRRIKTVFGTDSEEFERFVGRKPSREEMNEWIHYIENGIDAQLDWKIICDCAAEQFKRRL